MKRSYYTLSARLRPGWKLPHRNSLTKAASKLEGWTTERTADPLQWKNHPHVALANLGYDPERRGGTASDKAVASFITQYGPLGLPLPIDVTEEGEADTVTQAHKPFDLTLDLFRVHQLQLREAWEKQNVTLFTDPDNSRAVIGFQFLRVDWTVRDGRVEFRFASLYDYMGMLLARDIADGCAKLCQNPTCPTPYFVAKRRDAKYCSHKCAVTVNVGKFRRRQRRKKR